MNSGRKVIIGVLIGCSACAQESFIVPKTKKPSVAQAKEQCSNAIADTLKMTARGVTDSGALQMDLMLVCEQLVDQSFFDGVAKEDVQKYATHAERMLERQTTINQLLQEQQEAVQALLTKKSKH
jgi:hypothetical protein